MSVGLAIVFTLLSGYGDSQGFVHAAAVWHDGHWSGPHLARSAAAFAFGVVTFWMAVRFAQTGRELAAETITLAWFAVTVVGVGLTSRQFFAWRTLDQLLALLSMALIGLLVYRTA